MEAEGYSLDDKRTPTDRKEDIPDIIESFGKRREEKRREENPGDRKEKCFYVPAEEIKVSLAYPAASNWVFDWNKLRQKLYYNIFSCNACLSYGISDEGQARNRGKMNLEEAGRRPFMNSNFFYCGHVLKCFLPRVPLREHGVRFSALKRTGIRFYDLFFIFLRCRPAS